MHSIKTFSILAIAGSALAAPWGEGKYWNHGGDDSRAVATETAFATVYTTVSAANDNFGGQYKPTSAPAATATSVAQQQTHTQAAQTTATASSAAAQATSTGSSGSDYMSVVSEWRSKMGLGALTESDTLQANALKTVTDSDGQMIHELNPGSMAQVLAPGDASNFENVFVGGWLCEEPNLPGLNGICATMSQGWDYDGQTGHAQILSSTSYTKIGCALYAGIWGCDLA